MKCAFSQDKNERETMFSMDYSTEAIIFELDLDVQSHGNKSKPEIFFLRWLMPQEVKAQVLFNSFPCCF